MLEPTSTLPMRISLSLRSTRGSLTRVTRTARALTRRARQAGLPAALRADLRRVLLAAAPAARDGDASAAAVGDYLNPALFRPLRVAALLLLPLLYPLSFVPPRALLATTVVFSLYYALLAAYAATEIAMRPPWYTPSLATTNLPPYWKGLAHDPLADLGLAYTTVSFSTATHTLRGWLVPSPSHPTSTRYTICVHGAGRDRRNFLRHTPHLARTSHVLLFDTSEHGASSTTTPRGRGTSFGAREQHDIAAAARYLRAAHGAASIAIVGTSTGASSAILAAAGPLAAAPPVCVVAENPFSRADDLLIHHLSTFLDPYLPENSLSRRRARGALFWLAARVLLARMGQYRRSIGAADVAAALPCPLLVAHSPADAVVPFAHGQEVYERAAAAAAAAGRPADARFFVMADAAHCALFDKSPAEWVAAVVPFVEHAFERADGGCFVRFGPRTRAGMEADAAAEAAAVAAGAEARVTDPSLADEASSPASPSLAAAPFLLPGAARSAQGSFATV